MPFFFIDPMYLIIVGPAILLGIWAQSRVTGSFNRWSRIANTSGLTGAQAAAMMLNHAGVSDCRIEQVDGYLTDHYNPTSKTLGLSPAVYGGRSVAAIGVACHEAGHAIQHARGYPLLYFRSFVVPFASFGSWLSWPMIFGGMLLMYMGMAFGQQIAIAGVIAFSGLVVFQLLTLPVEFDASNRAKAHLREMGLYRSPEEERGVGSVLGAAAMTYVAATIQAVAQLLYFLYILGFFRGSEE